MVESGDVKGHQCNLTSEEILHDIEAISVNEEYRKKMYLCIDDKVPPQDNSFKKMEEFLKGTQELEDILKTLTDLQKESATMKEELTENVANLKQKLETALVNTNK